jgi:glycine cleavage system regulatory protein
MDQLVLTVYAQDKPGQLDRLAQCILTHEGNWLESRLSRMAGQFAGIVSVAVAPAAGAALRASLAELAGHGIQVIVADGGVQPSAEWRPIAMELVGNDRPGIVRDITCLLAEHGVNLERLVTDVRPAPMSNEPLFHAEAVLAVPLDVEMGALQGQLEALADELMVELVLQSSG